MLDAIIQEALHSYQFNTLTNSELRAIQLIVENAKKDMKQGKNSKNNDWPRDYDLKYEVFVDGKKLEKLDGEE